VLDNVPVQIDGENVTIGFNHKYMTDALKAAGTDEVILQANGPFAPMRIVPLDGNHFTFLVLPVRLKTE
jgi:DNA polymerase-3 subunit beta